MKWGSALMCVALAGCVTANGVSDGPSLHLRGCWIERPGSDLGGGEMRWFPDPQRAGAWTGHYNDQPRSKAYRHTSFTLAREADGWQLCGQGTTLNACLPVAFTEQNTLTPPNAVLIADAERLRFQIHFRGRPPILFDAARDGCD